MLPFKRTRSSRKTDTPLSPGDYLPHDADEIEGFKIRLNERLAPIGNQFSNDGSEGEWEIGETLAQWWRPNFETFMYPFIPPHVSRPKECKKLYYIQLPKSSTSYPSFSDRDQH
jgi:cleavage and polyadenylation specificity factor subunit 5